jgi:hypothetical protein
VKRFLIHSVAGVCLLAEPAVGQSWEVKTRADEYATAVQKKQTILTPERESKFEQTVERVYEGIIQRLFTNQVGFGLKFGGLVQGSGFAMGPRYRRYDLASERIHFETSLSGSVRGFYAADARLAFPRIAGSRFDFEIGARRSDAPSLYFFGQGPDSRRSGKTNYRREDNEFRIRAGWRPDRRHWMIGYEASALLLNIGPGRDSRFPSAEEVYGPGEAPGIDTQPNYLFGGPFVQYDWRDRPGLPARGGSYRLQWSQAWDRSGGATSFDRLTGSAEHYIPFRNEKRVIALHLRTDLSFVGSGKTLPFYMQPTLGGPNDLRGFQRFRYQANNATLMNAEYRWEVAPTLDMAVFADAGNVFERPGLIGFRDMKGAAGIGFRAKTRDVVVLRADVGASREGVRLWTTFSNIF